MTLDLQVVYNENTTAGVAANPSTHYFLIDFVDQFLKTYVDFLLHLPCVKCKLRKWALPFRLSQF